MPWWPRMRLEAVWALVRAALLTAMQYRASFLAELAVGALSAAGVAAPLFLVYARVPQIRGWTLDEALLVTGFFLLYTAFVSGIVEPNLGSIVEGVRTGSLDYLLLRPVDAQLVLSFSRVAPTAIWELLAGIVVIVGALTRLGLPSFADAAVALALLAAGLASTYSLWLLVVCSSFWFVRVDNLRFLLSAVTDAGRWPVSVYSRALRIALTTIVPVALVSSYPAMALLHRLDAELLAAAFATAAAMLVVSRGVLRLALSRYASASS